SIPVPPRWRRRCYGRSAGILNGLRSPCALVSARDPSELALIVQPAAVGRVNCVVETIRASNAGPRLERNVAAAAHRAWSLGTTVVLNAAVDVVREIHVIADRVEL